METPDALAEDLQYFHPTPPVPIPPPTYESDSESSDSNYAPSLTTLSSPKRGVEVDNRKTKRRRFSDEFCAQLCGLVQAGKTYRDIAGLLGVTLSTVGTVFKRFMETGSVSQRQRSGGPRKTTEQDDKAIVLFVKRYPKATQTEVRQGVGLNNVSNATVARRVYELTDIEMFPIVSRPFLSEKNRKKRLQWCKDRQDWTCEQWRKVVWSDESPFVLRYEGGGFVWRTQAQRLEPFAQKGTFKHDKKIMVWGCFSAKGVGNFYRIEGIMKKEQYLSILQNELLPSLQKLSTDQEYIFQQDNDPKHTAKVCQAWVRDNNVSTMPWPAQSPDLNPIENLWSILNQRCKDRKPNKETELFEVLKEAWESLPIDTLQKLADSMVTRVHICIKEKGNWTGY